MNLSIELSKELSEYANDITDNFTTKDYVEVLRREYTQHVDKFYDPEFSNGFRDILLLKTVLNFKPFHPEPCSTPLKDISSVEEEMSHILDNLKAYSSIFDILIASCKDTNIIGSLTIDILTVFRTASVHFTPTALKYDRYVGDYFSVVDLIRAVYQYGRLSGLVDYYNMEENQDGYKKERT